MTTKAETDKLSWRGTSDRGADVYYAAPSPVLQYCLTTYTHGKSTLIRTDLTVEHTLNDPRVAVLLAYDNVTLADAMQIAEADHKARTEIHQRMDTKFCHRCGQPVPIGVNGTAMHYCRGTYNAVTNS